MNFAGPFDSEFSHDSPVSLGGERFAFDAKPGFVQHHASDSHVVVPDAHLLFSGDYTRIGSDLIISGNNQKFVVGNYFKGETRPALSTKDGATLGGHIVDALTGHVHYAQATAAPAAGAVIGTVLKMSGSASVIRNGVSVELQIGAAVQKGDVIQTGSNSSIGMTFVDGSAFGMTSNARMVLNEMIFDPNGSSNSSLMSLVQGTVTFVAGQTAKNGNMRVETPVATMGIRGTAVLVEIAANDGPTKFSVLVEPDGTTGSFNLYDKVTGQLIGTVSQAGQVTFVSSLGIGQPPTAIEQLKTLADQQAEKAIIQQVFQLYFPNYNPDDSNPKMPKFGSNTSGNNLAEILFTTNSNNKQTFLTQIELRFAVTDPLTGITTYQNRIFYNTKAQFSALAVTADQAFVSTTETFKFMDVVRIDDPDIGNAPFYDIGVPFVAGSAVITSAVSTIGHLTEAFLKPLLHINQTTGVVSFDREQFNFLDDGETVTFMIRVTATSGPDTGTVLIPVTITGENDAPTIVVGAATTTTTTGDVKEDTDVTTSGDIVANGTITFQDVDLTDVHTATVSLTSTASSLPGFVAGTEIGEFTIDPVSESAADTNNHGSVGWHFKLADNNSTLQSLAKDQTITQTYTITIKDDNGVPVTQTVTITITGTNDVPTITAADVTQADTIYEIPGQTGGTGFDQNANGDTPSGSIHFADIDLIDRPTPTTVSQVISYLSADGLDDLTSTLTPAQQSAIENAFKTSVPSGAGANTNNGVVDWTYELVDNVLDFLAENETIKLVSIVRISDGNGGFADATVTINIVGGANDTPSIAAIADVGFIEQADTSPLQQTIAVNFTDVDLTDTGHVASVESVTANGVLPPLTPTGPVTSGTFFDLLTAVSATKATGDSSGSASFSFAADFTTFNYLALGETVTLTYIVAITDLAGTNGIQTVAVTITGTNDAPTVESVTTPTLVDTAAADTFIPQTGTLVGTDVDNGETNGLTYAAFDIVNGYVNTAVTGQYGSLTVDSDGTYSYVPNASAINALNAGNYTDIFTVQTSDAHGASGTATFTVNVTGANDAPIVAAPLTLNTTEGNAPVVRDLLQGATDADSGETATLTVTNIRYSIDGGPETTTTPHGITFPDAHTINIDAAGIHHLAAGATETIVVSYDVTDVHGATDAQTETIMIIGVNDRPVLTAGTNFTTITEDQTTNAGQLVSSFATGISDLDDGALKGVAITGHTSQNGHWEHSIDNGSNWTTFGTYSSGAGLLLASDDKVRFVPNGQNGGTDTLTYLAWDQTSGVHGQTANTAIAGFSAPFSEGSQAQTASLTVTSVNDAPVIDTSNVQISTSGGNIVISGAAIVDPDAGEGFNISLLPDSGGVSGALNAITYAPSGSPPQIGKVTAMLSDVAGADDTVNFIFNVSGTGPLTMQGTSEKDVFFATAYQDTFVFAPGSNHDTITGFTAGTDKIDLHLLSSPDTSTIASWLLSTAVETIGSDTLLHLNGTTDTLLLKGVAAQTLNASDFILHA